MCTEERVVVGEVEELAMGSSGGGGSGGDYYPFFGTALPGGWTNRVIDLLDGLATGA